MISVHLLYLIHITAVVPTVTALLYSSHVCVSYLVAY